MALLSTYWQDAKNISNSAETCNIFINLTYKFVVPWQFFDDESRIDGSYMHNFPYKVIWALILHMMQTFSLKENTKYPQWITITAYQHFSKSFLKYLLSQLFVISDKSS